MFQVHARRLTALLMALLLTLPVAAWAEEAAPVEAPLVEPAVPELDEMPLPQDDAPAPEEAGSPDDAPMPEEAPLDGAAPGEGDAVDAAVLAPEDAMVSAPGQPALAVTSLTLGAKEKATLTLAGGASIGSVGAVFTSSAPKIAEVDEYGVVTGRKVGSAVITMSAGGAQSSCTVTVRKAPKKITLSAKKLTLGVGEAATLGVTLTKDSASVVTFTSDRPAVATVENGRIVARSVGTATIIANTFNRKKAKCKVTVKAAPTYVTASVGELSMWQGRVVEIEPILSPGSAGAVSCASSNSGVVSVSGTTARAVAKGSATITLTTYNGLRAEIPVKVTKTPVYRALLIGESSFPDTGMDRLPGKQDVAMMNRMLTSVRGPAGVEWRVQTATDLTAVQIHSAIQSAFAGAEEGDVSLFYISSHGDQDLSIDGRYSGYAGCLLTYPDSRYRDWYDRNTLTLGRLAGWLCEVPGQVVVLIDSCGSGAAIYGAQGVAAPSQSAGEDPVLVEAHAFSPEDFDAAVIDAFRDLDRGVLAPGQGAFVLENKFYVMTSCAYQETGWSAKNKYSFFTKWVTDAVKTRGKMPADANKNRLTTLGELYACVRKKADKKRFSYHGSVYRQHVQVYPANSGFELFYR